MTSNVEPEEVQAILDLTEDASDSATTHRAVEVAPRDFERPLRLSRDEIDAARMKLRRALPEVQAELAGLLRSEHEIELGEVSEVSAEGLFASVESPLAVLRFEVEGQPGWLIWDTLSALAAVEVALGASEASTTEARELTSVERSVVTRILSTVVTRLGAAVGTEPAEFSAPETVDELGNWHDGGAHADRRRVYMHLSFDGPGGPSALRVYLPGVDPAAAAPAPVEPALPSHLDEVLVNVSARLGHSDIPLSDLLAIEPGDVIPLHSLTGEPVRVDIEDLPSALGALGSKNGNLAVRIREVGPQREEQ